MSQQKNEQGGESRIDRLENAISSIAEGLAGLTKLVGQIAQQPTASGELKDAGVDAAESIAEMEKRRDEKVKSHMALHEKRKSELPAGENKYRIRVIAETDGGVLCPEQVVGGRDDVEAIAKYHRFYGINGVSSPSKLEVVPVASA